MKLKVTKIKTIWHMFMYFITHHAFHVIHKMLNYVKQTLQCHSNCFTINRDLKLINKLKPVLFV